MSYEYFIYGCERGCEPPEAGSPFPRGVRRFRTLYGLRMHIKRAHGIKHPGSARCLMRWYRRRGLLNTLQINDIKVGKNSQLLAGEG